MSWQPSQNDDSSCRRLASTYHNLYTNSVLFNAWDPVKPLSPQASRVLNLARTRDFPIWDVARWWKACTYGSTTCPRKICTDGYQRESAQYRKETLQAELYSIHPPHSHDACPFRPVGTICFGYISAEVYFCIQAWSDPANQWEMIG